MSPSQGVLIEFVLATDIDKLWTALPNITDSSSLSKSTEVTLGRPKPAPIFFCASKAFRISAVATVNR